MAAECPHGLCDGSGWIYRQEERSGGYCRCRPQRVGANRVKSVTRMIPPRYQHVAWERPPINSLEPEVLKPLKAYTKKLVDNIDNGIGLWLAGGLGNGKTSAAAMIAIEAAAAGKLTAFYTAPDLISRIAHRIHADEDEGSLFQLHGELRELDLLVLDDLGSEAGTDWGTQELLKVVNGRYEANKAIVVTTNYTPRLLAKRVGRRIVSRLHEMSHGGSPITFNGPDHRLADLPGGELHVLPRGNR